MQRVRSIQFAILLFTMAVVLPSAVAQVVTATLPVGNSPAYESPYGVAVNSVTNKTYVANFDDGTVTVIDGATNNTTTLNVGVEPWAVAVNPATNKIYVVNDCGNDSSCLSAGTVSVIDANNNNNITTVNVGYYPEAVAVNSMTNQIYVANNCGSDSSCSSPGTVTVIDGASNNTTSVTVANFPTDVQVNSGTNQIYVVNNCGDDNTCNSIGTVTIINANNNNSTSEVNVEYVPYYAAVNAANNKIYVANSYGNDPSGESAGTATVIDANNNNNTTTVNVGFYPYTLAVDTANNDVYVENNCGNDVNCGSIGTVTIIDASNNTTSVNVGAFPFGAAADSTRNKICVSNYCGADLTCNSAGTVSAIDGTTNNIVPVAVGDGPQGLAVNATTNVIYVPNSEDASTSLIGGSTTLQLVAVPPCRLVDTRTKNGGSGPIPGGTFETFNLPQLAESGNFCPAFSLATAAAYSLNVTVVPPAPLGYLTIWPAGEFQPLVSTMNSLDGRVKANAAIVPAGVSAAVSVFVSDTSDVVLDIDGYFAPATQSTLAFYPLPPCRVADTRNPNGPLGGPVLQAGVERDFPVQSNPNCVIPSTAEAYSLNFTAVPLGG